MTNKHVIMLCWLAVGWVVGWIITIAAANAQDRAQSSYIVPKTRPLPVMIRGPIGK